MSVSRTFHLDHFGAIFLFFPSIIFHMTGAAMMPDHHPKDRQKAKSFPCPFRLGLTCHHLPDFPPSFPSACQHPRFLGSYHVGPALPPPREDARSRFSSRL